jgi:hypothetical protein
LIGHDDQMKMRRRGSVKRVKIRNPHRAVGFGFIGMPQAEEESEARPVGHIEGVKPDGHAVERREYDFDNQVHAKTGGCTLDDPKATLTGKPGW